MGTTRLRKEGVECNGIEGLESCKKHTIQINHHRTSDTVSIEIDGEHYVTFDDRLWSAIVDLQNERTKQLAEENKHGYNKSHQSATEG